ncbi:hypothetical protein CHS0354_030913, partial [Potamilus streckersoni]
KFIVDIDKPTPTMEKIECNVSTTFRDPPQAEIQQVSLQLPQTSNGKRWKWRTRFLVALGILLIVVAAVVAGAVYLGIKLTNETIHTFQASYKTGSQEVVNEKITLSTTEVKFQIPGKVDAVLDFDKGLFMYMRHDEGESVCFLTTFNASEGMAPKELKKYLEKTQGNIVAEREIHSCYKATSVSITNRNFLSPMTKDMCSNVEIFWIINEDCTSTLGGRQKRLVWEVKVCILWGRVCITVTIK